MHCSMLLQGSLEDQPVALRPTSGLFAMAVIFPRMVFKWLLTASEYCIVLNLMSALIEQYRLSALKLLLVQVCTSAL